MQLIDQVAIITGSARGIGRATALSMAREGASIVVADINEAGAQDAAAEAVEFVAAAVGGNHDQRVRGLGVAAERDAERSEALSQDQLVGILRRDRHRNVAYVCCDVLTHREPRGAGGQHLHVPHRTVISQLDSGVIHIQGFLRQRDF